ncbi:MAG: peptidoglycan editing factor PgeF [Nitrospirae bacterium]|nr:peptidoglycan editing factor PgeF [Nitrospirota bacterium]
MANIYPVNLNNRQVLAFFTDKDTAIINYTLESLSISSFKALYMPRQGHTDNVQILLKWQDTRSVSISDAVITNLKGILIGVKTADCLPILLSSKDGALVAAVHAGWRGTAKAILKKTLDIMINRFSLSADDILVAMGPSIRGCCYEVGPEVVEKIIEVTGQGEHIKNTNTGFYVDLCKANTRIALGAGVPAENIWVSEYCTYCNPERFHSYRYSKTTKRQGAFIGIKLDSEENNE